VEPSRPIIQVDGIRKTYGQTVAVDDVSFEVLEGEIFGLIGPNGAGKTTTMECVEGFRAPDRGAISVLSLDPIRDAPRVCTAFVWSASRLQITSTWTCAWQSVC
jgi:ABC-2 type transport system ATP-binding protein